MSLVAEFKLVFRCECSPEFFDDFGASVIKLFLVIIIYNNKKLTAADELLAIPDKICKKRKKADRPIGKPGATNMKNRI